MILGFIQKPLTIFPGRERDIVSKHDLGRQGTELHHRKGLSDTLKGALCKGRPGLSIADQFGFAIPPFRYEPVSARES